MRTLTSNKLSHKARDILKKERGDIRTLCIEIQLLLMNYPRTVQEKALVKMLRIIRGEHDSNSKDKRVVSRKDR